MTDTSTNVPAQPSTPTQDGNPSAPPPPKPEAGPAEHTTSRSAVAKALREVEAQNAPKEPPKTAPEPDLTPKQDAKPPETEAEPRKAEPKAKEPAEPAKDTKQPEKAKVEPEPGPERDESGRFKAKTADDADGQDARPPGESADAEPDEHTDAPRRLDAEAKAKWKDAPREVRGAVHRAIREMEDGIRQHQERWQPLDRWDQLAKQNNTTIHDALERYVAFEMGIRQNPVEGFRRAAAELGVNFDDVVAQISGTPRDDRVRAMELENVTLRQRFAEMEGHAKRLAGELQKVHTERAETEMETFRAAHPRFDELSHDISRLLNDKICDTLEKAYHLAELQNPSTGAVPEKGKTAAAQPRTATPQPPPAAAQPRNPASLSTHGAPASGQPAEDTTIAKSGREAARRALQRLRL